MRFPTLWYQIGLRQQVSKGEALWIGHAFCLSTRLAQIDFNYLIIDDLSQMNGRGVVAMTALEVFGHNYRILVRAGIAKLKRVLSRRRCIYLAAFMRF